MNEKLEAKITFAGSFMPYGRHLIEEDDVEAVVEVLHGEYLTTGPAVEAFEAELALTVRCKYAVSVSSGTAALHLANLALDLTPGDIAIVPSVTFLSTANAALFTGAEVVFADVDPETGLMTPETFAEALYRSNKRARVVCPVHLNGQAVDMHGVSKVTGFGELKVIEDACHVIGGMQEISNDTFAPVGSNAYGHMSTFSFHPVKTVAMGEGGAITTNDPKLDSKLRIYRNIGMTRESDRFQSPHRACDLEGEIKPWYYEMAALGLNYRASAIHCALGLSQLRKLDRFVKKRAQLIEHYRARMNPLVPIIRPLPQVSHCKPAWHLCVALIDFKAAGVSRSGCMRALKDKGIETQVHYIPLHRQPFYENRYGQVVLPGADTYYEKVLSLPLFVTMETEDVDFVVDSLISVLGAGG